MSDEVKLLLSIIAAGWWLIVMSYFAGCLHRGYRARKVSRETIGERLR